MTVHKSQGSEFEHAALILPARSVPLVTRELVYTAITRAKRRLSLYADEQVLSQAIVTRTERRSGLAEIFAGREALRRRVRAMENAAAVARAGGKSVTEEQRISQSAEIEFMAKKRTAAPPASGGVEQRAQKSPARR